MVGQESFWWWKTDCFTCLIYVVLHQGIYGIAVNQGLGAWFTLRKMFRCLTILANCNLEQILYAVAIYHFTSF